MLPLDEAEHEALYAKVEAALTDFSERVCANDRRRMMAAVGILKGFVEQGEEMLQPYGMPAVVLRRACDWSKWRRVHGENVDLRATITALRSTKEGGA